MKAADTDIDTCKWCSVTLPKSSYRGGRNKEYCTRRCYDKHMSSTHVKISCQVCSSTCHDRPDKLCAPCRQASRRKAARTSLQCQTCEGVVRRAHPGCQQYETCKKCRDLEPKEPKLAGCLECGKKIRKVGAKVRCSECQKESERERRPKPGSVKSRSKHLWREYRMTIADFDAMMLAQESKCSICSGSIAGDCYKSTPMVDHCHKTGAIRGLLCRHCNCALGLFDDDPDTIASAASHLRSFPVWPGLGKKG